MTSFDNIDSVGGTSFGALSKEEIQNMIELYADKFVPKVIVSPESIAASYGVVYDDVENLSDTMGRISSSLNYYFSALADPSKSTKYQADLKVASLVGGALSVDPLFGRLIVSNTDPSQTNGTFRADGKNSHMYSSSMSTTFGSTTIDTTSGFDLNFLADTLPSSLISPVKTWMQKLFPILTDKRLIQIAIVEGLIILLDQYLQSIENEQTISEQIERVDIATIIVDNQEIEDSLIAAQTAS